MRACHCSQTTAKITTRLNSAGTAQIAGKLQKSSRPSDPIGMFCGLPIKVAAEPALVAAARAINERAGIKAAALCSGD